MIVRSTAWKGVFFALLVTGCLTVLIAGIESAAGVGGKGASDNGPLAKEKWQQDTRIKAIEAIVDGVNSGISSGSIKTAMRQFEYCQPYGITERVIAKDAQGRARMYEEKGGSDNSDRRIKHYYTEAGQLRFVLITDKERGGGELVQKVYFDEMRKRLWSDRRITGAPETTFSSSYPDDVLFIDTPDKAFAAPSPCKEKPPK